eukprot:10749010-Karenia_brevis.AAC.1
MLARQAARHQKEAEEVEARRKQEDSTNQQDEFGLGKAYNSFSFPLRCPVRLECKEVGRT